MTSLTHYAPRLDTLRREFDRLFDTVLRADEGDGIQAPVWAPRTDISETEDRYVVRMDMPGLSKKDLSIELRDDTLTVSGERKSEYEEKKESLHRIERSYGRFFRSFTLPHASSSDEIAARMEEGVLTIEVPKREESRPRRIEIT
jgi:HSP20 family protein